MSPGGRHSGGKTSRPAALPRQGAVGKSGAQQRSTLNQGNDLEEISPSTGAGAGYCRVLQFRMCELNQTLTYMHQYRERRNWITFADSFFAPDASFKISLALEKEVNHFKVHRLLIPRFFMTYFECVAEQYFDLNQIAGIRYSEPNRSVVIDAPYGCLTTTHPLGNASSEPPTPFHNPPINLDFVATIRTKCHFIIEFDISTFLFRNFTLLVRTHHQYLPGHGMMGTNADGSPRTLTRGGIPNQVVDFLRASTTMFPMQELMTLQKQMNLSPRECLKAAAFEKFQLITNPPKRPPKRPGFVEASFMMNPTLRSVYQAPAVPRRRRRKKADVAEAKLPGPEDGEGILPPPYGAVFNVDPAESQMNGDSSQSEKQSQDTETESRSLAMSPGFRGLILKAESEASSRAEDGIISLYDDDFLNLSP